MFVAMSFCLPIGAAIHAYHRRQQRRAAESEGSTPLLDGNQHGGEGKIVCITLDKDGHAGAVSTAVK